MLLQLATKYLAARKAQERDHTDAALNYARTEAHDAFIFQLNVEGIPYEDREHTVRIAQIMGSVGGFVQALAQECAKMTKADAAALLETLWKELWLAT